MKFLGIMRASALCLLAIGFHSQFVSCGIFKGPKKPKEDSNAKVSEISENLKDSTVKVRNLSPLDRAKELGVLSPKEYEEFDVIDGKLIKKPEAAKQISKDIPEYAIDPNFPVFAPEEDEDAVEAPFSADVSDVSEKSKDSTVKPQVVEDALEESSKVYESENPKESTVQPLSQPSSPLPQSDLVFQSSKWHDSQLPSAVLSLEEFCRGVNAKKFSGSPFDELYEGMKGPCLRVSYYARSYIDHLMPHNLHDNTYKDALKPDMFKDYIGWLKKNIPGIIGSLEHLFNEFKGLSEKQLINDASFVPVMYGFEFHDAWSDRDFKSNLRHKTYNLINALKYLYGHF